MCFIYIGQLVPPVAASLFVRMHSFKKGVAIVRIYPYPALYFTKFLNILIKLKNKVFCKKECARIYQCIICMYCLTNSSFIKITDQNKGLKQQETFRIKGSNISFSTKFETLQTKCYNFVSLFNNASYRLITHGCIWQKK